jgi:hypothetical protein
VPVWFRNTTGRRATLLQHDLHHMGAVAIGVLIAPRRVWRAFLQGRRCSNLYHLGIDTRWPDDTVGSLRLGLYGPGEESRGR